MNTLYRAQVLLEREQHEALAATARKEGRSISALLREIIAEHLDERARESQMLEALQALQRLAQIRKAVQEQHGVHEGDLLAEVRAEREDEIEAVWQGKP